jgi:hypothetical protein
MMISVLIEQITNSLCFIGNFFDLMRVNVPREEIQRTIVFPDIRKKRIEKLGEILKAWRDLKRYEEKDLLDLITFWIE